LFTGSTGHAVRKAGVHGDEGVREDRDVAAEVVARESISAAAPNVTLPSASKENSSLCPKPLLMPNIGPFIVMNVPAEMSDRAAVAVDRPVGGCPKGVLPGPLSSMRPPS